MKFDFLSGYKTYAAAATTIFGLIVAVLVGDMALVDAFQPAITAIFAVTIRKGISSDTNS